MKLLTWNIQCGRGCDGVTDLARIVSVARQMGDIDVFCFQEVSDHFSDWDAGRDQSIQLAELLPEYSPIFRPAIESVDGKGGFHRFGNMTLSRLPLLQVANHLLPWSDANQVRSMRRHALEVTVQTSFGPLRITNTHLEYHSASQRAAQIERLLDLQEEASTSPISGKTNYTEPYASQTLAASGLLCGDFNFDVKDPQHALIEKSARQGFNYRDTWAVCHPARTRDLTCGIYDTAQWTDGPDCRDFIFVTDNLTSKIKSMEVNLTTDASDHQPILVELAD